MAGSCFLVTKTAHNFISELGRSKERVEQRLDVLLSISAFPKSSLVNAARYAVLGTGKRFRPIVSIATAMALGAEDKDVIDPACAIEFVHAASLIMDDLPCMDDAKLRRGKPACHILYGEDITLLTAISLLNQSYAVISAASSLDYETRVRISSILADSVGFDGLAFGQALDLHAQTDEVDITQLEVMQKQKTASLFVAATEIGALVAGAKNEQLELVKQFGLHMGRAFQILDDLLDATGEVESVGKDVGQDAGKPTFASLLGVKEAEQIAQQEVETAMQAVTFTGDNITAFASIAHMMLDAHMKKAPHHQSLENLNKVLESY